MLSGGNNKAGPLGPVVRGTPAWAMPRSLDQTTIMGDQA